MESSLIGLIGLVGLLVFIILGVPIAFSFFAIGAVGLYCLGLRDLAPFGGVPFAWATSYTLMAAPLFILMGLFAFHSGISSDLYDTTYKWVGHLPGGLAMATTLGCTGFAAVSGSSLATAATMGTVSIPHMRRRGYKPSLIGGSLAAGGTLGIMIPPSIGFIVYALLVEESVGKLFMAGILPGLMVSALFLVLIYWHVKMKPELAPLVPAFSWKERITSLRNVWGMAVLFLLIMGGIYGGIFTPTEAAAVGCTGALLLTVLRRRLTKQALVQSVLSTIRTTGMIFLLFIGAMVFSTFVTLSGMTKVIAGVVGTLPIPPLVVLGIILFTYIPLGCLMDSLALLVLTVPIYLPIFHLLGFNLIWIGVLMVRLMEIGLITPPMGLNLFVIKDVAADIAEPIPLGEISKGVLPFIMVDLLSMVILVAFPQISLLLPSLMQ